MKKLISLLLFFIVCVVWNPVLAWQPTVLPYVEQSTAPTVNNDSYPVPYLWVDTTNDEFYFLTDNTPGAASWLQLIYSGGAGVFDGLTVQDVSTGGASNGPLIQKTFQAGETYSGTEAGLLVKAYDADATVVHGSGEHAGLALFFKPLSSSATGGESMLMTLHQHSSGTETLTAGLMLYPKVAGSAVAVRASTVDYGYDLADAGNTVVNTADFRGHEGEILFNDPDGTWNFGSANIVTQGGATIGTTGSSVGKVGIGTTAPDKATEINSTTGDNLRLTYNDADGSATNYTDFSTSAGGDLTVTPSGGDVSIVGNHSATSYSADATSSPGISVIDSDQTDPDVTGSMWWNATATGTGAEVADWSIQSMGAQGTAGTLETAVWFDGSAQYFYFPTATVAINTSDLDGTPAIGTLTVKGGTNDGSTNIFVARDSDEANTWWVDTNGANWFSDLTDSSVIKHVQEPGLGGRLTIGLDETARTMVICDAGDVDTDFGLAARSDPRLQLMLGSGDTGMEFYANKITYGLGAISIKTSDGFDGVLTADNSALNPFTFRSDANIELTDTDGEQSWLYVEPKINQSATASYNGLQVKVTETALGDGSTGTGATNNLIVAGTTTNTEAVKFDNSNGFQRTSATGHGGFIEKIYSASSGTLTGATDTIELNIPSGWVIKQCQLHVKTAVVDDAGDDTWSAELNDTGTEETIVSGAAAAQNTNVNHFAHADAGYGGTLTDAETDILLTPNGGSFSAGEIEAHCLAVGFDNWDSE